MNGIWLNVTTANEEEEWNVIYSQQCNWKYIAADNSKFDSYSFIVYRLDNIDAIVTDDHLSQSES